MTSPVTRSKVKEGQSQPSSQEIDEGRGALLPEDPQNVQELDSPR